MLASIVNAIRQTIIPSILISLCMGGVGMAFWFYVEEVDEDLCFVRSDGQGLVPLYQQFGPEVYCDPKWGMVAFGTAFYAIFLFRAVLLFASLLRLITWLFLRHRSP